MNTPTSDVRLSVELAYELHLLLVECSGRQRTVHDIGLTHWTEFFGFFFCQCCGRVIR